MTKLSKFYPGYPEPGGSATVRQLLNHTSGIMSYTSIPGWMERGKYQQAVHHGPARRSIPRPAVAVEAGRKMGL